MRTCKRKPKKNNKIIIISRGLGLARRDYKNCTARFVAIMLLTRKVDWRLKDPDMVLLQDQGCMALEPAHRTR